MKILIVLNVIFLMPLYVYAITPLTESELSDFSNPLSSNNNSNVVIIAIDDYNESLLNTEVMINTFLNFIYNPLNKLYSSLNNMTSEAVETQYDDLFFYYMILLLNNIDYRDYQKFQSRTIDPITMKIIVNDMVIGENNITPISVEGFNSINNNAKIQIDMNLSIPYTICEISNIDNLFYFDLKLDGHSALRDSYPNNSTFPITPNYWGNIKFH